MTRYTDRLNVKLILFIRKWQRTPESIF